MHADTGRRYRAYPTPGQACRHLTEARADLPWLADLPAQSAQQVLRQLDRAFDNWWNPEHPAQAPTFRKRRQDFIHKLTTDLAKSHGWVAVEDLRVRGMTRSAKSTSEEPGRSVKAKTGLNRAILDNAPYERRRQLASKAPRFGSELRLVRQRSQARHARRAALVTRSRGQAAAGCSPAPPAAMLSTRT